MDYSLPGFSIQVVSQARILKCIAISFSSGSSWSRDQTWVSFPGGAVVKNPSAYTGDVRDAGSIPGSKRSPGKGNGSPLQYSYLENPMDRGAWQVTVHEVAKSWTQLSNFHLLTQLQSSGLSIMLCCSANMKADTWNLSTWIFELNESQSISEFNSIGWHLVKGLGYTDLRV